MASKKTEKIDDAEEIEVKVKTDEKEVWKLNCVESLAYRGVRDVFVGAFMVKDLLTLETKEND